MKLSKEAEEILKNTNVLNRLQPLPYIENFKKYHQGFVREVTKVDFVRTYLDYIHFLNIFTKFYKKKFIKQRYATFEEYLNDRFPPEKNHS